MSSPEKRDDDAEARLDAAESTLVLCCEVVLGDMAG